MGREPAAGLRLGWNKKTGKYDLVFGPISGDLYEQLNQRTALLVYTGKLSRQQLEAAQGKPKDQMPLELKEIYEWYGAEIEKRRFDPTRWIRCLVARHTIGNEDPPSLFWRFLLFICEKLGIIGSTIRSKKQVWYFPILGVELRRIDALSWLSFKALER